ncbi:MAG TPA: hypothetical protein VLA46_07600 [Saprospiraceae bacterium]|nr:hypothetical protein [Saprospiraceae bacterium]
MNFQKLAIATVAGAVFLLLLDMVWYTMIMTESMDMPNMRPEPDMMWMIISYVIVALAFAAIYSKWSGGGSKVNSGLNYGLWIGLLAGLGMNLMWFSLTTSMTLNQVLSDSVYTIVKYIIAGIIVAFVYGMGSGDRGKASGGGE